MTQKTISSTWNKAASTSKYPILEVAMQQILTKMSISRSSFTGIPVWRMTTTLYRHKRITQIWTYQWFLVQKEMMITNLLIKTHTKTALMASGIEPPPNSAPNTVIETFLEEAITSRSIHGLDLLYTDATPPKSWPLTARNKRRSANPGRSKTSSSVRRSSRFTCKTSSQLSYLKRTSC